MHTSLIGILIALIVSCFLLYTRKESWANPKLRWIICIGLFIIGLKGLFMSLENEKENAILFWGLCVPIVYYSFDRFFRQLSFNIYKRDFILWLHNSNEIDESIGANNPHVRPYDKVFSIALAMIISLTILLGVILFGKDDFYTKWFIN